jgi:methionine aminopeptidase
MLTKDKKIEDNNFEKYKTSSKIVNKVLNNLFDVITDGIKVSYVCALGDKLMNQELDLIYRKKKLENGKGISMPTCVSINNIAGYYSPIENDDNIIRKGDIVKVELGVHVDGFICINAKTKYLEDEKNKEKVSILFKALNECKQEIKGKLKVGKKIGDIPLIYERICKKYNLSLLEADVDTYLHVPGLYCYQLSQGFVDSYNEDIDDAQHKMIVINKKLDVKMYDEEIRNNDVFIVDIMFSTGKGKLSNSGKMPMIYLRNLDNKYMLKLRASKNVLHNFNEKKYSYPKNIREIYCSKTLLGLKECIESEVLEPYYVLKEKSGEYIVQDKFVVVAKLNKNHYL